MTSGTDDVFVDMQQNLVNYGVGFVHRFDVEPAFQALGVTSFFSRTANPTDVIELHSMLLVGVRYDAQRGEFVMLLQNWWESKEFVEVGQAYWKACHAQLLFVRAPQTALREGLRTVQFVRAAAGVVGAGVLPPRRSN